MMDIRIYVEKKNEYQVEALCLREDLNSNLGLNIQSLRLINLYDVFNISEELLSIAKYKVFGEIVTDIVSEDINIDGKYLAVEYLPGQFDQRASSAEECISLIDTSSEVFVRSGKLIIIDNIEDEDLDRIKKYYINEVESREKDLKVLDNTENIIIEDVKVFDGFKELSESGLNELLIDLGLAMSIEDLKHIQKYFISELRDPTETEIRMLDTYWSDHCRHTTFETTIENVEFSRDTFNKQIEDTFNKYLKMREFVHGNKKPLTLMDMATISGKYERKRGNLDDLEISDEINACSVYVDVDVDGEMEKWLLMFKNETHNHPTEIEPFGGASTCVGGAIRDPLSGRSFVYQAMRVSGAEDPTKDISETIEGKLPQKVISKAACDGFSSYGNQIGLATTHVREIYHPGFLAKRMEVGAVVGAVKADYVRRERPVKGDVVIMFGGRTGRDGIGGATGSSKEHTTESLETASAEVQKGNAPEERKIQRLFRNKEVTRLIKKSNDFGAGGVSVAIGEIADSLDIDLDKVKTKYKGLNGTELAISESQERMAVVVEAKDKEKFLNLCKEENLEATQIATVTDSGRLVMYWNEKKIVDLSRDFIDTNGVIQSTNVKINTVSGNCPLYREVNGENLKDKVLNNLSDLNVATQKGMIEQFDATVGRSTVLMPFGGKYQTTASQSSVHKFPVSGFTNTASIMAFGYNPYLSEWSPFHGAAYAVLESLTKIVTSGASYKKVRFSFQEYFEKLDSVNAWGKPFASLLGSIYMQEGFNLPSIGGKDSMSGTFKDIKVPPTLISFAVTTVNTKNVVSPEFKGVGNYLYVIKHNPVDLLPNISELKENFDYTHKLIESEKILSAYAVKYGGISEALVKASLGNKIGFDVNTDLDLFSSDYGSIIVECNKELDYKNAHLLGMTTEDITLNSTNLSFDELSSALSTFSDLYPTKKDVDFTFNDFERGNVERDLSGHDNEQVKVFIPVFPGMNSEYDMIKVFEEFGGTVNSIVFRNQCEEDIKDSIKAFVSEIDKSHIIAFSGGFSAGDEPDGSGKFIASVLNNKEINKAINELLNRDGLVLGICNGFQALVKSGLLPFNEGVTIDSPTLFRNDINRHVSNIVQTKVKTNNSPWLSSFKEGEVHRVAISNGEGKFVVSEKLAKELYANDQIAFQYVGEDELPTMDGTYNPSGSEYAIEGIVSKCGRILGKMGHSERYGKDVFKNIPGNKDQNIFKNAISYFRKGNE
ncbi:phosphoribosylformylglycinamidine synthase [Mycoplasmatota bacterium]|nr:phosphoribosylformylglycinamidine synthase [Mycoplasmatota bacterium]